MADSPYISPQKPLGRALPSASNERAGGQCTAQAELPLSTLLLAFSSATQSHQGRCWEWAGKLPGTHLFMQPEDFCASLKVHVVLKMWRDPPLTCRES